ncbi:hypothetical protein [Nocardia sp. NPDC051832]|uniref:hypothetical protein n=1 Tax=Nocardia sp. NPDC051832 TaxID=3155673 RepID=UPI00342CCFC7
MENLFPVVLSVASVATAVYGVLRTYLAARNERARIVDIDKRADDLVGPIADRNLGRVVKAGDLPGWLQGMLNSQGDSLSNLPVTGESGRDGGKLE